jgi:hypothetical protein
MGPLDHHPSLSSGNTDRVRTSFVFVCLGLAGLVVGCSSDPAKTTEINSLPVETVETTVAPITTTSAPAADSWADVVARVRPAIVSVEIQTCTGEEGTGSGFAIDGWILTNRHVVEGYRTLVVVKSDGTKQLPDQVRVSRDLDLALIKMPIDEQMLWSTDAPRIADEVAALGYPRAISFSFTKGSISALDVRLDDGERIVTGLLQTDAAVNPGNSGGPLIDRKGNVLGVVVLKRTDSEGLAFAIDGRQAQVFLSGQKGDPLDPCDGNNPSVATEPPLDPDSTNPDSTDPDGTEIPGNVDPGATSPEETVRAFYAAVESKNYDVAWELGGRNLGKNPDLESFAAGYKDTLSSETRIVEVDGNFVTVEVTATERTKTGTQVSIYVGTYEVVENEIISGKFKLASRE